MPPSIFKIHFWLLQIYKNFKKKNQLKNQHYVFSAIEYSIIK